MDNEALIILATKLGTTAEYLWGVLLKQAPIAGVTGLLLILLMVVSTVGWCWFVWCKTTRLKKLKAGGRPFQKADWDNDTAGFALASVVVLLIFVIPTVGALLTPTIAALINPEYWALRQILQ